MNKQTNKIDTREIENSIHRDCSTGLDLNLDACFKDEHRSDLVDFALCWPIMNMEDDITAIIINIFRQKKYSHAR